MQTANFTKMLLLLCVLGLICSKVEAVCEAGNFIDPADDNCKPCPLSTFNPDENSRMCHPCFTETDITRTTGAKSFEECVCELGSGRKFFIEPCVKCEIGTYGDGTVNSTLPPPLKDMCKDCPAGFTTLKEGATDASNCTACRKGYYISRGTCLECPKDTYSDSVNADSCTSCPTDQVTSGTGSDNLRSCHKKCAAGQYRAYYGCTECSQGTYSDGGNETACTPCPDGYSTPGRGATAVTECTECAFGYERDGDVCEGCPVGEYYSYSGRCQACPTGKTTVKPGAYSEDQCVCAVGYYERQSYRWSSNNDCVACPVGTYSDTAGAMSCIVCPTGMTTTATGETALTACGCRQGYYVNGGNCTECPKDTYSDIVNSDSCTSCPADQVTSHTGSDNLRDCHEKCPAGQYRAYYGCTDCREGSYSTGENETACTSCPDRYSTPRRGATAATDCTECAFGYVRNGDVCEECPAGKYYSYYSSGCEDCPTGRTTTKPGAQSPDQCVCAAGYYERVRDTWRGITKDCVACPVGTYSDTNEASSCTDCPRWTTTNSTGETASSACVCEAGTVLDRTENVCVKCGVGSYSENGATKCTACPTGSTTLRDGVTSPDSCVCQAGYFQHPASGVCQVCPANSYTDKEGLTICTKCPAGKAHSIDHTSCE